MYRVIDLEYLVRPSSTGITLGIFSYIFLMIGDLNVLNFQPKFG
jgi:hypothetical protein